MFLSPPNSVRIDLGNLLPGAATPQHFELLDLLIMAHRNAALNNANLSKTVCVQACYGSGKFRQGVAAGVLSIGDVHAPLQSAREVYEFAEVEQIRQQVANGMIVPGFGNSFFKTHVDPAFKDLYVHLKSHFPEEEQRIAALTDAVWRGLKAKGGKTTQLWPNAALFTAAVCKAVSFPHGVEELLFLLPRMPVWAEACMAPKAAS